MASKRVVMRIALLMLVCALSVSAADKLAGRVWERAGEERRPLAKAQVSVVQEGRGPGPSMTRSDAEGRWRIAGPLTGRVYVSVSRPGYFVALADGTASAAVLVDCQGPCGPVDFELQRGGVVSGIVEDDQGEPLQNVSVRLEPEREDAGEATAGERRRAGRGLGSRGPGNFRDGPQPPGQHRTNDLGRFRVAGLKPGRYRVRADLSGRPDAPSFEQASPPEVEVKAGEEISARLVLERGAGKGLTVSGVVTGLDLALPGRHMLNIQPASIQPGQQGRFGRRLAGLQEDGEFELSGLVPGRYFFAYSRFEQRGPGRQIPLGSIEVRGSMAGIALAPVASVEVAGRFEIDSDHEARGATAALVPSDGSPSVPLFAGGPDVDFRQSGLYPGVYKVLGRSREWFLAGVSLGENPVDPAAVPITSNVEDLVIVLSDRFARVEGRIRPPEARYTVSLSSVDDRESRPTDQHGAFVFDRLVPGEYRICVRPSDAPRDSPCVIERRFPAEADAVIELELSLP